MDLEFPSHREASGGEPDHPTPPISIGREYYVEGWTVTFSAVMVSGLAAFGAFGASVFLGRGDPFGAVFGLIAVIAVGLLVAQLRQWRRGDPALVLSEEGILDNSALVGSRFIPWSDIQAITLDRSGATAVLRDDRLVKPALHRRVLNLVARRPMNEYLLPTVGLVDQGHEVGPLIQDYHEHLLLEQVRESRALASDPPPADRLSGTGDRESPPES